MESASERIRSRCQGGDSPGKKEVLQEREKAGRHSQDETKQKRQKESEEEHRPRRLPAELKIVAHEIGFQWLAIPKMRANPSAAKVTPRHVMTSLSSRVRTVRECARLLAGLGSVATTLIGVTLCDARHWGWKGAKTLPVPKSLHMLIESARLASDIVTPGALPMPAGVRYRVWAPAHESMEVRVFTEGGAPARTVPLLRVEGGYFEGIDPAGRAGDLYKFRLPSGGEFPDPASRAQAAGVHGPSRVVDARGFAWRDGAWQRPPFRDLVIYELHLGTFSPEGTFRGAIERLAYLRELGINAIELMPVADFPGGRGWGYDGVLQFAPAEATASPDDLRALVDAAHAHGHRGDARCRVQSLRAGGELPQPVLAVLSSPRRTRRRGAMRSTSATSTARRCGRFTARTSSTGWRTSISTASGSMRRTRSSTPRSRTSWRSSRRSCMRAAATSSPRMSAMRRGSLRDRGATAGTDSTASGRMIFTTSWRSGCSRAPSTGAISRAASWSWRRRCEQGWYYSGQLSKRRGKPKGTPAHTLPPERFVYCISNHDQIGNRAFGERLNHLVPPAAYRAASALLLLTPHTPLLFMGQEWGASTPFQYFTDHEEELGHLIEKGRREEFREAFAKSHEQGEVPSCQAESTFLRSKLNWAELRSTGARAHPRALP